MADGSPPLPAQPPRPLPSLQHVPPPPPGATRGAVPVRTILATIGMVLLTLVLLTLLREGARVVAWILVAGFFTVVLNPAVDLLQHRARLRRGLATLLVFLVGIGVVGAMLYAFITPIVDQSQNFVNEFPDYVEDAKNGEGPVGSLVKRFDLDTYVEENQQEIEDAISDAGKEVPGILQNVFATLAAMITVLVLTFLMLLRSPGLCSGALALIPERHRERVRVVARDAARAISGYMLGNFLISLVAGVVTYIFLRIVGVPYPEALALWVAFTDLIPLVGATLGAILVVLVAFLDSTTSGIASVIFFIAYQQFENHVLQVSIMSKTVNVNPLTVLVSVLFGVELFGLLGALLAIPFAGVVQVVARNLYDERGGVFKDVPTVGEDEIPVTEIVAGSDPTNPEAG